MRLVDINLVITLCVCDRHSWIFVSPDTTHLKPVELICELSVLSYAQNHSITNVLPSMRDDDNSQLGHHLFGVFRPQCIGICVPSLHNTIPTVPADALRFGLYPVLRFLASILKNTLLCHIRLGEPFFSLLINLICDVYTVMTMAYIFDERSHVTVILLRIETSRFLFRSHDFAAIMFKSAQRLLHLPPPVLRTLLCKYMTAYRSFRVSKLFSRPSC